jgi:hypothetical protein
MDGAEELVIAFMKVGFPAAPADGRDNKHLCCKLQQNSEMFIYIVYLWK